MTHPSSAGDSPLFCPILGMHRSGTSCLMRILHSAGVETGDNLALEARLDNLTGHWESLEMLRINDHILESSGGGWDRVPESLVIDEGVEPAIREFLKPFADSAVVSWKDPRLTITFPAWRPYLPNYTVVACVRHPHAVANSLMERGDMDFAAGVRLWTDYNERLLEYAAQAPRVFWFHYDGTAEAYAATLNSFCEHARLNYSAQLMKLFNPGLTHHFDSAEVSDPRARKVYRQLLELSLDDRKKSVPVSAAHGAVPDQAGHLSLSAAAIRQPAIGSGLAAVEEPQVQMAQLIEILRALSLQQQRDQKTFREISNRLQSLEQQTQCHAATIQKVARLCRWMDTIEQSAAVRIYRSLRGFVQGPLCRFKQHSTRPTGVRPVSP